MYVDAVNIYVPTSYDSLLIVESPSESLSESVVSFNS